MHARHLSVALLLLALSEPLAAFAPEEGLASWYGGKFQGRRTASGEIFDTNQFTAAHKTLPLGTYVKVTHLENGQSIIVRVNDRGPFVSGRVIDLSSKASQMPTMRASGGTAMPRKPRIRTPSDAADLLRENVRTADREIFWVLHLDADELAAAFAAAGGAASPTAVR
mgnify:CR=1 FL=1